MIHQRLGSKAFVAKVPLLVCRESKSVARSVRGQVNRMGTFTWFKLTL